MIIEHLCAADPGMAMDLELSVTGSEPGKVSETIYWACRLLMKSHSPSEVSLDLPKKDSGSLKVFIAEY